jgi:hypothetical protein
MRNSTRKPILKETSNNKPKNQRCSKIKIENGCLWAMAAATFLLATTARGESISGTDPKIWHESTPSSGVIKWTQASPGNGGTCWRLKIHPAIANSVFESCDIGSTNRNEDGSRTYQPVNDSEWTLPRHHYLNGIRFRASKPDVGYAVSDANGAFRTDDKGKAWAPIGTELLDALYLKKYVMAPLPAVAVNPDKPAEVWIGFGFLLRREIISSIMSFPRPKSGRFSQAQALSYGHARSVPRLRKRAEAKKSPCCGQRAKWFGNKRYE